MSEISELLRVLEGARVYDLGLEMRMGMPVHSSHPPYFISLWKRHSESSGGNGISGAVEVVLMCGHHATHLDALCHFAENQRLHGGIVVGEVETASGYRRNDISEVAPLVGRAVLLDVPRAKGAEALPNDYAISVADLESCISLQGVAIGEADVVLLRTGWSAYWNDEEKSGLIFTHSPGLSVEAARWLAQKKVRAVGTDADADVSGTFQSHKTLLADYGVFIIERLYLEGLAGEGRSESLFVCLPLKMKGATGSPVRPVAIVPR